MSRFASFLLFSTITATTAFAGAIIDLRPNPPIPEFGYDLNQSFQVDVYLLDNANNVPVSFTMAFLDSSATDDHLTEGPTFNWVNPFNIGSVFSTLPAVSWVYPLPTPNPSFQITLPDDGEVKLGDFALNVGGTPGVFELNLLSGARFDFSGGSWTDANGQITGGVLPIPVAIPEPASMLLGLGCGMVFFARKKQMN